MAVTSSTGVLDLIGSNGGAKSSTSSSSTTTKTDTSTTDRFLKLLITQMQNQDPLNPMDNAQVTSQMAQISTVSGIQDLNTTVSGLNAQFASLQAVQGASLVGHDVTLTGNRLALSSTTDASGEKVPEGLGGFELASAASSVKVTIKDGTGKVVDTLDLGAQPAGMNGFSSTKVESGKSYTFSIEAQANGSTLSATPLMLDHINAVSLVNNKLTLQTSYSGAVDYTTVKAVN